MRHNRKEVTGLLFAFLGVLLFSLTLPMTKWAIESFDPLFTATARPVIAALLAIPLMVILKVPRYPIAFTKPLIFAMLAGVFGWPILSALALQRTTSAHVAVIAAILPLITAIYAVVRTRTKVSWQFWAASACGTILLILFALTRGGGSNDNVVADLLILLAVLTSAYFSIKGAELAKVMPSWQVISWVVVLALPICLPASIVMWTRTVHNNVITTHAIIGLCSIGLSSMYLGYFAWFRGLRDAGTAHGSQVQQLQTIMTLGWAAVLLGESVTIGMLIIALGVIGSVLWALTSRQRVPEGQCTKMSELSKIKSESKSNVAT